MACLIISLYVRSCLASKNLLAAEREDNIAMTTDQINANNNNNNYCYYS